MVMIDQKLKCKLNEDSINGFPSLVLVVPCYNESETFQHCHTILETLLSDLIKRKEIKEDSFILFVDDGSSDDTWNLIQETAGVSPHVKGIKLSRNYGHQIALIAGLSSVIDADICISLDADLQDDVSCIEQMIQKYKQGCEIVYGVRNCRVSDTVFKRNMAYLFYMVMKRIGVEQVANHADYRLLSRRALKSLLQFKEQNVYIRGLIPLLGYKSDKVFYTRQERLAGVSKYTLRKMLSLAIEGITSFSVMPLRYISILGFLTCLLSLFAISYVLVDKFTGHVVQGWTSVIISIFFLSGVQLLSLGVIGEYIGKIYMEIKGRPKFFIEAVTEK